MKGTGLEQFRKIQQQMLEDMKKRRDLLNIGIAQLEEELVEEPWESKIPFEVPAWCQPGNRSLLERLTAKSQRGKEMTLMEKEVR